MPSPWASLTPRPSCSGMAGYVGIPKPEDIAAQYRHHAAQIADGDLVRPARALLIEFDANGVPRLYQFGPAFNSHREGVSALLESAKFLNAEASN